MLQRFIADTEHLSLPLVAIIPGIVVHELDNQKNRSSLAWSSRRASAWLLKRVKERKGVRVQANEETCKPTRNWKVRTGSELAGMQNDSLIIDCAQFVATNHHTFLLSGDRNLCLLAESTGIQSLSPPQRSWSSRDLARHIFGDDTILRHFTESKKTYKVSKADWDSNIKAILPPENCQPDIDDSMDVDDEDGHRIDPLPSHPLDLLHMQVVEHFTRLLCDLVEAQRPSNGGASGVYRSMHAERIPEGPVLWDATRCINYLDSQKTRRRSYPDIAVFLRERHSGGGARLGQEWPQKAWQTALSGLNELSSIWRDEAIRDSLHVLLPEVDNVFKMKMKPTGT